MRRTRFLFLVAAIILTLTAGLAKLNDKPTATPAATVAATSAVAEAQTTATQQHATQRPVVVTAIGTAPLSPSQLSPSATAKNVADGSYKAEVIPDGLNVRNAPGGAVVGSLKQGAIVTVRVVQGEWAKIGDGRFVAVKYLRKK